MKPLLTFASLRFRFLALVATFVVLGNARASESAADEPAAQPPVILDFVQAHCLDCHAGESAEAGLDLETLPFDLTRRESFDRWLLIHDRIQDGEMPPPDDEIPQPVAAVGWSSRAVLGNSQSAGAQSADAQPVLLSDSQRMLQTLAGALISVERRRVAESGRSKVRRLNRYEYENTLRSVLDAPWLQVADALPEDGVEHLFNKVGERLDTSHVQMTRWLSTADRAIRLAVNAAAYPAKTTKSYAREERSIQNYLHYRFGQMAATRSIVPLIDTTPEPDVIRRKQPVTVGDADPQKREREAMGVFSGVYSATTKYDFTNHTAPTDGFYRLRFKTYTFMAGPNGADGGDDHGLTGGDREWWRPDRNVAFPGQRSEPITLYALSSGGDSRWLTTFDSYPDPSIFECVVPLRAGEGIRPDAARLVRTRPGWAGNPNATRDGVPGFAMNWLEVQGPLQDTWPPASYQAIFADLPFEASADGVVKAISDRPSEDARQLLTAFYRRAVPENVDHEKSVRPFVELFAKAVQSGQDFTDATILAMTAILCSPEFLYFDAQPGPLSEHALQQRLSYFLWNGPPSSEAASEPIRQSPSAMQTAVDRMLDDDRVARFVASFLDYWLDLRDINANTPDSELYPDYYLDELLTESSIGETRMFFEELIAKDLPAVNLVKSDFVFANERLAEHYALPSFEGVTPRRVELPAESPRGGLLTQASVLRVTANGTTTSPVTRGAWIMERIVGIDIPPPPSGIAAVEPDIRGATTIREQLDKHREIESCNACHAKFDPAGFALESFDVTGGWRGRYRAIGGEGEPVDGYGKNGHAFKFKLAQVVDCSGTLRDGQSFADVRELKRLLASDERQLARNLLHRLIVYATGAPVSIADRAEVEVMLDRVAGQGYGVRSLIHELAQSDLFRNK